MRNGAAVIAARSSPSRRSQTTPVARREERSQPRSIGRPQHAHDRVVVGLETDPGGQTGCAVPCRAPPHQISHGRQEAQLAGKSHDATPALARELADSCRAVRWRIREVGDLEHRDIALGVADFAYADRKSTRLNSSHLVISYAVFCLKKKKKAHKTN